MSYANYICYTNNFRVLLSSLACLNLYGNYIINELLYRVSEQTEIKLLRCFTNLISNSTGKLIKLWLMG